MSKISVSIIGYNETKNLENCLKSLSWANEIVFVDCESSDNSIEIVKQFTDRIYSRPNLTNLNVNKSFGISQCKFPWVLYLDPDERIPEETANWILSEIKNPASDAYFFPRKNHILGSWLKHGSQYPDYQLRLFKKEKSHFPCEHVHERLQIDGSIGKTKFPIIHFPYPDLETYLEKFNFYTTFEANFLIKNPPGWFGWFKYILFKPVTRFIKRYFLSGGFLDGFPGFVAAFFDTINFPVRYFKYIEQKRAGSNTKSAE